ncbi:MAG: hypothetical protein ACHRHE_21000 [Tepidisphaerales bacterium]
MRDFATALAGVLLLLAQSAVAQPAAAAPPVEPATYLCDAPDAPADALAGQWLSRAGGWSRLEEDDKTHTFRGRPVFMNDKIVAVLEADTPAISVYSRQTQGAKLCARLQPVCDGSADLKRVSVAIKENSRSTIALEIGFRAAGNAMRQITYELSAGQPFIKTTGGAGVERLRVYAPCRFAVLPDFFADDIVVDASTIAVEQAELPSENFLLHLMHGGEAIVMTVSESRDNDVVVRLSGGASREIASSDVFFGKKPHIWVTVLAEPGIWHQRDITAADTGKVIPLDWRMPFTALWRVDWSKTDKLSESWEMLLQDPSGKYVMQNWFGQKESEGQNFGVEFGARDWNKPNRQRWNPVLGAFKFPCWIDNDRSGYLQPLEPRKGKETLPGFAGPVLVYPIDRVAAAPFATPLEKLTVVDLVRMTLGVGPCEYILDLEGQKRNSRGVATCYARDVINAIYKEGSQLQQGPAINEQLTLCVAFIGNVRERIDQYVQFGHEMTAYLEQQKRLRPAQAAFFDEMLAMSRKLDAVFEQSKERFRTPAFAQQTADDFRANLLTYAEKDAYDKCATQMAIFTSIGGAQDDAVASCRMIVKTLRQRAGIAMAVNPDLKEIATEIRQRTQVILRKATAYEAPRH